MLTIDRYIRAESPAQAYELCQKRTNVILGGMLWLKQQNRRVSTAIDLADLGLDQIEETAGAFRIGAMVNLRTLETHAALNRLTGGAFAAALSPIVGVQFRNLATVGGSVFGRFGFSDVLTLLLALDAQIELYHGGILPLSAFAAAERVERDVLLYVIVPKTPIRVAYRAQRNQKTDFPVLTAAVSRTDSATRCVIGARPLRAVPFSDENGVLTGHITEENARLFAENIATRVTLAGNHRAGEEYRRELCRVLVRRAALALEE